jgi:drug/metabolite transporter (DMT)-like permease
LISTRRTVASGGPSGLGWAVLAMLLLGAALAMWKPLTEAVGPAVAVLAARLIAAGSLYVYFRVRRSRPRMPLGPATWRILAGAAVLDGAGFAAYNLGLDGAPITVVAPLAAAHPLATIGPGGGAVQGTPEPAVGCRRCAHDVGGHRAERAGGVAIESRGRSTV